MLTTRKGLVKKLWKASLAGPTDDEALSTALRCVFRRSDIKDIKSYALAKDGEPGPCWSVSSQDVELLGAMVRPQLICCKVFRWPDLDLLSETVVRLPICGSESSSSSENVCCNPYHFGRRLVFAPASLDKCEAQPSTKLLKTGASESISCDSAFGEATCSGSISCDQFSSTGFSTSCSESESGVEFSSEGSSGYTPHPHRTADGPVSPARRTAQRGDPCLKMAYWEGRERVGRLKSFATSAVHVHYDGRADLAGALCIGSLKNRCRSAVAEKKRQQIGKGFMMWRTAENTVMMYNASQQSMYVQSPTIACQLLHNADDLNKKLPAGSVVEIFNYERAFQLEEVLRSRQLLTHPFDVMAVRVSLVAGWGPGHRRPTIMECPFWIETFFFAEDSS